MVSERETRFLPWWLWGIVFIEVAVPTFYGVATIFDPGIWGATQFDAIGQLYVTRNFTMAAGVAAAALILRSHVALLCAIAMRYATDFVDIAAAVFRGPPPEIVQLLLVFTVVLLVIPVAGLLWLWRRR